jgi:DNA polymerase III subunit beta
MDFLIQRDELIRALSRVQGIVEKRSTTPILSTVLMQAHEGGVRVTATDKAMTYVGNFVANVNIPGEVAVDAAHAFQVAKVLPSDVVSLQLGENQRVDVRCGKSYYKLAGQAAGDFPPVPSFEASGWLSLQAADLRRIIDQTWFSIAPDDNRYGLNGAHLDAVDTPAGPMLRMVGTDGNRLSWAQAPYSGNLAIGRRMLLPRKPLQEVRKMIDGFSGVVEIGFGERAAVVRFEGTTVHMRLLEAEFPNYKEVLPTSFKRRVVVDRDVFVESLKRVSIFATDGAHSVRFAFGADGLVLTARKLDVGDAREEVPLDFAGEPIVMGFNARFIQEVLNVLSATRVTLELGDTLSPCILRPMDDENALFVVMPVRLD